RSRLFRAHQSMRLRGRGHDLGRTAPRPAGHGRRGQAAAGRGIGARARTFVHGTKGDAMRKVLVIIGLLLCGSAWADVGVTAKGAKGVEKRQPVGEATEFAVKDTVWIWTEVTGAPNTKIKHVWMRDGKEEWSQELAIGDSKKWVTNSRRTVKAGS